MTGFVSFILQKIKFITTAIRNCGCSDLFRAKCGMKLALQMIFYL